MFKSPAARILMGILSLLALVFGIMQTISGVKQLMGFGEGAACNRLIQESDQALKGANDLLGPTHEKFAKLLSDFDAMELAFFRRDNKVLGSEVEQAYDKIATGYREAIEKIEQAQKLNKNPKLSAYLISKSKIYAMHLSVQQKNQEIVRLPFDESLTDSKVIVASILRIAEQRDKIQSQAEAEEAAAAALVKK